MLRQGLLNKQIAYELQVGETTVKAHVSEILRKLNVYSRTQAVIEVSQASTSTRSSPTARVGALAIPHAVLSRADGPAAPGVPPASPACA